VVFLAAVSALFLMTILSGLLGWVATQFIPRSSSSVQNSLLLTILSGLLGWVATQFIPRSSS
jgi:putative Ca2+/H+ antiporter (TMEM165/GDT1 family)